MYLSPTPETPIIHVLAFYTVLHLYPYISTDSITSLCTAPIPYHLTSPDHHLSKSHTQLNSARGSAEGTATNSFSGDQQVPTQHPKDIHASEKWGQTLSGTVHNHFGERERAHT